MLYGVYDIKNSYQCVGIFENRKQVADFFNTTPNVISSSINRKYVKQKRYVIERIIEDR